MQRVFLLCQKRNWNHVNSETCIIEGQLSIDDQVPMKKDSKDNKKTSVAKESVEKAFVAQRTSIERSSPPSFKDEVIT